MFFTSLQLLYGELQVSAACQLGIFYTHQSEATFEN